MAIIKDNLLVRGASGNVGKQFVYRKRGKDTLLTRMPVRDENAEPTEKQEKVRELFAAAASYAKGAIADPELKAAYRKKAKTGKTAYNIAFRDFMKAPVVKDIDTSKYNGTPGSAVGIVAKDDFRVAEVMVSIRTATGELVEEGNAVLNPINRDKWIYTTKQSNAALSGSVVHVTARDLPGNQGIGKVTV
jgi:hypothetical protein